jgi:hypothetical protein
VVAFAVSLTAPIQGHGRILHVRVTSFQLPWSIA